MEAVGVDFATRAGRTTARKAGRDADVLEYTRWGSIDMSRGDVEAQAADGVTRLVVGAAALDQPTQREEISAFAERLELVVTRNGVPNAVAILSSLDGGGW